MAVDQQPFALFVDAKSGATIDGSADYLEALLIERCLERVGSRTGVT